jgi:hypothetical protein
MRHLIVHPRFQAGPQFTMRVSPDPEHKNLTLEHFAPLGRVCSLGRRKSVARKFASQKELLQQRDGFGPASVDGLAQISVETKRFKVLVPVRFGQLFAAAFKDGLRPFQ